jgi:lysophospholipase L1-like esterase
MSSLTARIRANADLIALNLALLLAATAIAATARGLYRNSLEAHPEWVATKASLAKPAMGEASYVVATQALARNRLNLDAWFGFQEVLYRRPLDLTSLTANVRFEPDGYVYVLYDVRKDGFSGVRISSRRDLPSTQFAATLDGGFISQEPLAFDGPVAPDRQHVVRLLFDQTEVKVVLDERQIGAFRRVPGAQRIGFRAGIRASYVDDVALQLVDGTTIHESFTNTRNLLSRSFIIFGVGALVLMAGCVAAARWSSAPARSIGLSVVLVNLCLLLTASAAYAYQYLAGPLYHLGDVPAQGTSVRRLGRIRSTMYDDMRRRYPPERADSAYRILFLGSSQTWGAGASTNDDVWVSRLEHMLDADFKEAHIECINAGVPALVSSQVLMMARELVSLRPRAAVINLSNNDRDTTVFRANMDSLVSLLTSRGIRTVVILEPNSPERRVTDTNHGDLAAKHRIVARIAAAHGVPVVDMHSRLAAKNRSGLLWWDFVHLTSFGQKVMADTLRAELAGLLHLDSLAMRPITHTTTAAH